jgi:hypothetical protein
MQGAAGLVKNMRNLLILVIMLGFGFEALANVHNTCDETFNRFNNCTAMYKQMMFQRDNCTAMYKQMMFERDCLAVLCTVSIIACIMLAWSQSRTAKITSDNAHDSANQQVLAKNLEMEVKHLEMKVKHLTLKNCVYNEMLEEQSVNVAYCVILGPLLKFECMPCFYLCKNIKQLIKWFIHWNLFVDVIFYLVVLLPFIAIFCVGYEIWSKQTVSPDVMLSAMNTNLNLVMTPGMMVWNNIKPSVCAYCTNQTGWWRSS